jgi:hypothetical protein
VLLPFFFFFLFFGDENIAEDIYIYIYIYVGSHEPNGVKTLENIVFNLLALYIDH